MGNVNNPLGRFAGRFGDFGVDLFFVLSGFVMAHAAVRYNGAGTQYWINRVVRIIPNYWFYTTLLVISIRLLPRGSYLTSWQGSSLVLSYLLIPNTNPNGYGNFPTLYAGWTLTYEMFFYLMLSLTLALNQSRFLLISAAALVAVAVGFGDIQFLGHSNLLLLEFVAGMAIYAVYSRRPAILGSRITLLVGLAGASGVAILIGDGITTRLLIASVMILVCLFCEELFRSKSPAISFLRSLGDYSYSTYLSHIVIIGWFYAVFGNHLSRFMEIAVLAGILVTVYCISRLTYKVIETGILPDRLKAIASADRNQPRIRAKQSV